MTTVFVVCAALGGTILVLQSLMALLGLGGDSLGVDVPHDVGHDFGGMDHDLGGLHGDMAGHDVAGHDAQGGEHASQNHSHHDSSWMFRVLSFRTLVAALAFFGLAGLAAESADCSPPSSLAIAMAAGLAAMYAVFGLMEGIRTLKAEGTVRIQRAVGHRAEVYLRIPSENSGMGKIHVNLQNRTMEYQATTAGQSIPTGAAVVVTEILGPETVRVERVDGDTASMGTR